MIRTQKRKLAVKVHGFPWFEYMTEKKKLELAYQNVRSLFQRSMPYIGSRNVL